MTDSLRRSIGVGTDVHRLADGVPLHLAGLAWPDEPQGLEGHSDGTSPRTQPATPCCPPPGWATSARRFGTAEPEWAGAAGTALLAETARLRARAGYDVGNVAVQIIGNRPQDRPAPRRGRGRAVAKPSARR